MHCCPKRLIYIKTKFLLYLVQCLLKRFFDMHMNRKNTQDLFKLQIFLFFSEALSMYNKITNENTDNSAT